MSEICFEERNNIKLVLYADDVMLWTSNEKELEENLNQLNNIRDQFTLKITEENAVIQKVSRNRDVVIQTLIKEDNETKKIHFRI